MQTLQIRRKSFTVQLLQELSLARTAAALVQAVERRAGELAVADRVRLYAYDAEAQALVRADAEGRAERVALTDADLAAQCAAACQPLAATEGALTHLAFPLMLHGTLAGVLLVAEAHLPAHEALLESLGELCGVAVVLLQMVGEIEDQERFQIRTQDVLVRAVEGLAPGRAGHVTRLGILASDLAALLDMSPRQRRILWQAAQYHDVGRVVLCGSDPADVDRHHPGAGADYLGVCRALQPVARLVEAHHARYDGSGQPPGLAGDAVPLEGWILALAEDVEGAYRLHDGEPPGTWIPEFLAARRAVHHPSALEALRMLYETGRLAHLYS